MQNNKIKITLIKSLIGRDRKHRKCVKALGLRRMNHSVILNNDSCIKGLVNKIDYLLKVENVNA